MAATVFLAESLPAPGEEHLLAGDEGRHAAAVRRVRTGEELVLSDGAGGFARCTAIAVGKADVTVRCAETWRVPPASPRVVLVQALPKSDRSELAVELATEAGIDAIVPWQAARCVSRWDGGKGKAEKGVARWRAVARSAAKQARRAYVPEVHDLVTTRELVPLLTSMDANVVVLHEGSAVPLGEVDFSVTETVVIVVGPEGGISPEELEALVGMGAQPALLGPTVLRTSTAAAVALGALGVMTDRWSGTPPD
ncbi:MULTISPECIES: 16S rRNA (uracil(1498)-N(3))-methyltransferase [Tsukamurella]|uniref:Ribosomal RNA small subunit methyltransferase E n=2 Tax=Tsukamurella TaxID=2060 RepID=A0A5C5S2S3_9ACTN|nr:MULTISPECIES: 16S rRNA (uracil(1498)-N(3))-methyltransferase [Tsukamurella]NMD54883.1 16S rRNA (uracil(1498)-N(3))-methyltransferase [Tsukamurella columbiensis]TWS29579.1 16S rRNA (uracil(1498)-N(3))-methyltransferase [Tsukamurella conjunctivitidis]